MIVCFTLLCQASLMLYCERKSLSMTLLSSPTDWKGSLTPSNEVVMILWFMCFGTLQTVDIMEPIVLFPVLCDVSVAHVSC